LVSPVSKLTYYSVLFTVHVPNTHFSRLNRYGGIWPITQSGSPIANVTIAGYGFQLYFGYNGAMKVYTFITSGGPLNNFTADVKLFFNYLTTSQGYPASTQNLIGMLARFIEQSALLRHVLTTWLVYQIGSEAFTGGPARFSVSEFSADVNM
jgi:xyloglucan-specific endo-beta-1,4-glucanase